MNCDLVIWTQPSGPLCLWQCLLVVLDHLDHEENCFCEEVTVLTTEKERKKTRLFDCPIGSQNSVSGFLFYNVIPILPRSRVTQMDECSKLLQYRSNFLQRPLSCFKRSSEAGFRLFDVKKIHFWKQQCMLLATGKYRIFFQFLPAPHSLQNQNQNKTNEMSQPGALVNEEFHGATASCGWLQINLKVGLVS